MSWKLQRVFSIFLIENYIVLDDFLQFGTKSLIYMQSLSHTTVIWLVSQPVTYLKECPTHPVEPSHI
jgi:hypothetical protein